MKKFVCFLYLSFLSISLFGQETYNSVNYSKREVLDKSAITSFFSSDTFQFVIIAILALILLFWVMYMYSSFQVDRSAPPAKAHRHSPDRYRPGVNFRYKPIGLAALNTVPVENKKNDSEEREKKKTQRVKEKK